MLSEKSSYTEWKGLLISTCPLPAGRLKLEVRRVTSYYSHTHRWYLGHMSEVQQQLQPDPEHCRAMLHQTRL